MHIVRAAAEEPTTKPAELWRDMLGEEIRATRTESGQRLIDVARRAGVSPQYLSEIERGKKDASSEMVDAIAGALGRSTLDLARSVVERRAPEVENNAGAMVLLLAA